MSELIWTPTADDEQVAEALTEEAAGLLGGPVQGVWAAPGRVNLIGEHTDYNGGWCLPFALSHRTYVAVRRRDDGRLRIASRQASGQAWEGSVAEVGPATPGGWASYVAGVASVLAERVGAQALGADVLVDGHVPLGAGLSSSAALSCSVALALHDLVPELSGLDRADLASTCVRAENEVAGAATGGMDQSVSLRAVDGHALLIDCRDFSLTPVAWTLPDHDVLVIDTRAHHSLADGQYASRRAACERACSVLGVASLREVDGVDLEEVLGRLADDPEVARRVRHVLTENARVLDLVAALAEREAAEVGRLMGASHDSLRDDYEVSCPELDLAVESAVAGGAVGARMTGGGFGGSAIALVPRGQEEGVAGSVATAFADRGWEAPHFLTATPSAPACRVR
ncbi:galactokinase [Serinicoccus kebangsaanensis]|uniref:galactokinase n=1 Tax=Serinicoccus kebangsaanensis TaxID=2602069 RepID=UPI00124D4997|nr:galactokinase [Serinicoccus kebangsaanensis]